MFTRTPGKIRPRSEDADGEADPPITPVPANLPLINEYGETITDENDEPITV